MVVRTITVAHRQMPCAIKMRQKRGHKTHAPNQRMHILLHVTVVPQAHVRTKIIIRVPMVHAPQATVIKVLNL